MTKRPRPKRHHTERQKKNLSERWTNAKAAWVGFCLGRGWNLMEISRELNDGTSPQTITSVLRWWKLPEKRIKGGFFMVKLSSRRRALAIKQAEALGITPEEYLRRICDSAVAAGLYDAITDGAYK